MIPLMPIKIWILIKHLKDHKVLIFARCIHCSIQKYSSKLSYILHLIKYDFWEQRKKGCILQFIYLQYFINTSGSKRHLTEKVSCPPKFIYAIGIKHSCSKKWKGQQITLPFWFKSGWRSARRASFFCSSSWTSFNFSLKGHGCFN